MVKNGKGVWDMFKKKQQPKTEVSKEEIDNLTENFLKMTTRGNETAQKSQKETKKKEINEKIKTSKKAEKVTKKIYGIK